MQGGFLQMRLGQTNSLSAFPFLKPSLKLFFFFLLLIIFKWQPSLISFTKLGRACGNECCQRSYSMKPSGRRQRCQMKPTVCPASDAGWRREEDLPANTKHLAKRSRAISCLNKLARGRVTSVQPVSMTTVPKVSCLHGNCHHRNL